MMRQGLVHHRAKSIIVRHCAVAVDRVIADRDALIEDSTMRVRLSVRMAPTAIPFGTLRARERDRSNAKPHQRERNGRMQHRVDD